MKKRVLAIIIASVMIAGCGANKTPEAQNPAEESTEAVTESEKEPEKEPETAQETTVKTEKRMSLLGTDEVIYYDQNLVPSVPSYTIEEDLSNVVINPDLQYRFDPENTYFDGEGLAKMLAKNGFAVVADGGGNEFFDIYEGNRYSQIPNFIAVDSLMHTYHLYFSYLLKNTEKTFLDGELKKLSAAMLEKSKAQYEELKGTDWEKAALRNVGFFYIGSYLQNEGTALPVDDSTFKSEVEGEIDKIMAAGTLENNAITGVNEDYTQYKPRGYYEGDEQLEKYFRAMMWYGRSPYELEKEEMVKSAVLQTAAISGAEESWESIYNITSFFAGASDDPGFFELSEIMTEVYGENADAKAIADNKDAFSTMLSKIKELKMPQINSIPVNEGENSVIPSYRFMGQRFTIDAAIMQRLVFSNVGENANGDRRYLPDTLDTAAALGSKEAFEILTEIGATEFKNYTDNLTIVSDKFNNSDATLWNASLYAGWLNTLRPLFEEKGEGYPMYMQSSEWAKKNLETFAGSYAELKHDTILYAKQLMAEMGGGSEEVLDDRGYVDPQPVIYSRFKYLSEKTKEGLEGYGMLDDSQRENLNKLSEMAGTLLTISEKELKNEDRTDEEYEFIREYGGYLEHFWVEVNQDDCDDELVYSHQCPCPIVADIATDPNGTVLEVATGKADDIYVVFPIDGELHLGRGSVYSFYQFETDMSNRLTDSEWRLMLSGGDFDENWNWVEAENPYSQPEWTTSYRLGN